MTNIVGIIPAGGKAQRFGGIYKELLPIGNGNACGLVRCVEAMRTGGAEKIIVSSTLRRFVLHRAVLDDQIHVEIHDYAGLWEYFYDMTCRHPADRYFFAMPDTVFPLNIFFQLPRYKVSVGVFRTSRPERFGVFNPDDGLILDKGQPRVKRESYLAWGVWAFQSEAMKALAQEMVRLKDHTLALNSLIRTSPPKRMEMPFYYDFATFDDYREYLCTRM